MYSEQTQRERAVDFVLPIAKRQIMFSKDECLQYGYCGFEPSLLTPEARGQIEPIYLSLMNDSVSQITDYYPIVEYYSENTDKLNRFVERISVGIASGRRLSFDDDFEAMNEIIEDEVVAYITNPFNVSTEIYYYDLCKLLYQKPKLTVTDEGVLLFYTPTTLFATLDCKSGNLIGVEELAKALNEPQIHRIRDIFANSDDGDTVIRFTNEKGKKFYKDYKLTCMFDFFSECGVTVKIGEFEDECIDCNEWEQATAHPNWMGGFAIILYIYHLS